MFKIDDYLVYKRDVCKVIDIREKYFNNQDYYVLVPVLDTTLKECVPINNKNIRKIISKKELNEIINKIPSIEVIKSNNRLLENDYKNLMNSGTHEDLIRIIKTTYLRNKERIDNNKKITDKDDEYFKKAEKYLYNEFSFVLGMSIEETKKYVYDKVEEIVN